MSTGPGVPSGHLSIIEVAEMFVDGQSERRRLRSATVSDGVQPCLGCKSKNTLHVASEKPCHTGVGRARCTSRCPPGRRWNARRCRSRGG